MISIRSDIIRGLLSGKFSNRINTDVLTRRTRISNVRAFCKAQTITLTLTQAVIDQQIKYLDHLDDATRFKEVVCGDPDTIIRYQKEFEKIITGKEMFSDPHKGFRNKLIYELGYKSLRDSLYPEYFEEVGIKACVYCNSQLALTVTNVNAKGLWKKKRSAKFQVDHYFAKSKYPCFSISFFNLYPVCASCNNSKSSKDVKFQLYSDDHNEYGKSQYNFRLDKLSLLKYRINGQSEKLKIVFEGPEQKDFNQVFAIEGIYETQKDVAEELILKSMIYNKSYSDSLKKALAKLYKEKQPMAERLLIGNYTKDTDMHRRPMSKFTMDIAKQLGLIK